MPPRIKLIYYGTLLMLSLLAIISVVVVDKWWVEQFHQQQYRDVEQQLTRVRNRINLNLQRHFQAVSGLPALFRLKAAITQQEFESTVKHLIDDGSDIRHVAVAPDLVIQYMYPIAGNEAAIGFDYRSSPEQLATVQQAIDTKKAILAGPLELVQGGEAFILRLPMFIKDKQGQEQMWGVLSSVIDAESFFQQNRLLDDGLGIKVAIRGKDGLGKNGSIFFGDAHLFDKPEIQQTIALPMGEWLITAEPMTGWRAIPDALTQQRQWLYLSAVIGFLALLIPLRLLFKNVEANDKFRRLIDGSPTAQLLVDQHNRVTYLNQAFIDKFTYTLSDMQDRDRWQNICHTPDKITSYIAQQDKSDARITQVKPLDIELLTKDHVSKNVLLTVSHLSESHNQEKLVSLIDISQRKKVEQQLLQTNGRLIESEALLKNIFLNLPDLVWLKNVEGVYLACNREFEAFFGAKHQHIVGKTDADFLDKTQSDQFQQLDRMVIESNSPMTIEEDITYVSDGRMVTLETIKTPLSTDSGETIGTLGIGRDITERKRNEEALLIAAKVYENSNEAMVVTNERANIVDVNPAFTKLTGYSKAEAIGRNMRMLSSGKQNGDFYQTMWQSIANTGSWEGEVFNRKKNGEIYLQLLKINAVYDNTDTPSLYIGLFHDISEQQKAKEEIWHQAHYDSLTNLPNRLYLINHLDQEIKKAKRHGFEVGVLFLDLDGFKDINDTFGHDIGDELLMLVSDRLLGIVREVDVVARQGGDEFLVVMSQLPDENATIRVADQIIHQLNAPFEINGEQLFITVSIGASFYPYDGDTYTELMKTADQAMYSAKEQGKNRVCCYTQDMQEKISRRMQIKNELYKAMDCNQFELYFQPVISLTTGKVYKVEALIRWNHPVRGLVPPVEFIPIAEETKLINEIGYWVFQEVCAVSKVLTAHFGDDFQISFNLSPAQLGHDVHHPLSWLSTLAEQGVNTRNIVVEITESMLMDKNEKNLETLLVFRDAGIEVAIDDFGTGYSSLAYISKYDIDYLKIDREFIKNISDKHEAFSLCEAIIVMAQTMGIKVIAEGVETTAQKAALSQAGCDFAQGYLFSKPVPLETLLQLPKKYD